MPWKSTSLTADQKVPLTATRPQSDHRCVPSSPCCRFLHPWHQGDDTAFVSLPHGKACKDTSLGGRWIAGWDFSRNAGKRCWWRGPGFPHARTDGAVRKGSHSGGTDTPQLTPLTASPLLEAQLLLTWSRDPTRSRSLLWGRGAWHRCCRAALAPQPLLPLTSSSSVLTAFLDSHCNKWQGCHLASPGLYFSDPQSFSPQNHELSSPEAGDMEVLPGKQWGPDYPTQAHTSPGLH